MEKRLTKKLRPSSKIKAMVKPLNVSFCVDVMIPLNLYIWTVTTRIAVNTIVQIHRRSNLRKVLMFGCCGCRFVSRGLVAVFSARARAPVRERNSTLLSSDMLLH